MPRVATLLVLTIAASACGGETGILIEVTRDRSLDLGDRSIATLEFVAARQLPPAPGQPTTFADAEPVGQIDVTGRDLATDPYKVLLRPGGDRAIGAAVAIAVRALGDDGEPIAAAAMDHTVQFVSGKVLRYELLLRDSDLIWPDDCSVIFVDGRPIQIGRPPDADCDGFVEGEDCDDLDPGRNPGAHESCTDGIDNDCDDGVDEESDDDGDSFTNCNGDCNDRKGEVHPGADEVCDGLDNDCNGDCDSEHDGDGDLFTECGTFLVGDGLCSSSDRPDCDDSDPEIGPGAPERCDGIDNDCSGECEDANFDALDPDGDSFTQCGSVIGLCSLDPAAEDCAADDGSQLPTSAELCNGRDDNCDGELIAGDFCLTADAGTCRLGERICQDNEAGWDACVDLADPAPPIPSIACDNFSECDAGAAETDPMHCLIERLPVRLDCKVHYVHPTGGGQPQLCPGASAALPMIPVTDGPCEWQLLGGVDQTGYRGGLTSIVGDPVASLLTDCSPLLAIEAITSSYPHEGALLFGVGPPGGDPTELVGVSLHPRPVQECDNRPALDCTP